MSEKFDAFIEIHRQSKGLVWRWRSLPINSNECRVYRDRLDRSDFRALRPMASDALVGAHLDFFQPGRHSSFCWRKPALALISKD